MKLTLAANARALASSRPTECTVPRPVRSASTLRLPSETSSDTVDRSLDELGEAGRNRLARLLVEEEPDEPLAVGVIPASGSTASISAGTPLSFALAAITACVGSTVIEPSASVTIWPSIGLAIERFL